MTRSHVLQGEFLPAFFDRCFFAGRDGQQNSLAKQSLKLTYYPVGFRVHLELESFFGANPVCSGLAPFGCYDDRSSSSFPCSSVAFLGIATRMVSFCVPLKT